MLQSKRFRITMCVLVANFILFGIGIFKGTDLISIGTGLAMLNTPLYGYLWGETNRPSGLKKDGHEEITKK